MTSHLDRLALVHDDHLCTLVNRLDAMVMKLMPAVSAGRTRVHFECAEDVRELADTLATVADYLADLREGARPLLTINSSSA